MLGESLTQGTGPASTSAMLFSPTPRRTVDTCKKVSGRLVSRHNILPEPDVGCPIPQHSVPINSVARQVSREDFNRFTHILAADESNLANLKRIQPKDSKAEVRLFGSYDDNKPIVVSDLPLSKGRGLIFVR